MTGEEEAELATLWKRLVKLYHPDRFANEPDKLETYGKLTGAINRATCGRWPAIPHSFILRQGWASLDFRDEEQVSRLRKLWESLEMEIVSVIEEFVASIERGKADLAAGRSRVVRPVSHAWRGEDG